MLDIRLMIRSFGHLPNPSPSRQDIILSDNHTNKARKNTDVLRRTQYTANTTPEEMQSMSGDESNHRPRDHSRENPSRGARQVSPTGDRNGPVVRSKKKGAILLVRPLLLHRRRHLFVHSQSYVGSKPSFRPLVPSWTSEYRGGGSVDGRYSA